VNFRANRQWATGNEQKNIRGLMKTVNLQLAIPRAALGTNWEVNLIVRCGLPKAINSRK